MTPGWAGLSRALAALRDGPPRTGSLIATLYGDAILPRGGALALTDLLTVMRGLGASDGMVRTAVSRLARDGLLEGRRTGRRGAYRLTPRARAEFAAAGPAIYGGGEPAWDGWLHVAMPDGLADRTALEAAGYAAYAPGVLLGLHPADAATIVRTPGDDPASKELARRAWPLDALAARYRRFIEVFEGLAGDPVPQDAVVARTALIHAWRRVALRDPRLPTALLPDDWPGHAARALCVSLYAALAAPSETWLDGAGTGDGLLPPGPDPVLRFSGGGRSPAAPAWSPAPAGSRCPPRSTPT